MSDELGSSGGTCGDEDRKGKRKYSDDDKKQTGEQNPSSGLSDEDLASFHSYSQRDGTSLDELLKQQLQALQHQQHDEIIKQQLQALEHQHHDEIIKQQLQALQHQKHDEPIKQQLQALQHQQHDNNPLQKSAKGAEDLSILQMYSERDGSRNELLKQQLQGLHNQQRVKNLLQKSAKGESPQENRNESTNSDEVLIFELQIFNGNRYSIPYAMASDHFPPMENQPNSVETLNFYDPLGQRWTMTLIYNSQNHAYVITNGLNDYIDHNRLRFPDVIRVYLPVPQLNINDFYIQHHKELGPSLFDMLVPRSNRLRIPYDVAENYFDTSEAPRLLHQLKKFSLHLTDYLDRKWEMKFVCFNNEKAYVVFQGWEEYAAHHSLNHNDTLRFFRKDNNPIGTRFAVYHELRRRVGSSTVGNVKPPLFLSDNLFCDHRLSTLDVVTRTMEMAGARLPRKFSEEESVKLTDVNNKDWYVTTAYDRFSSVHMIYDGWKGFAEEHKLEVGDIVRLYEPVEPDHDKHFLIECVKKKKTEKEEGGSGSGKPDHGAGPS